MSDETKDMLVFVFMFILTVTLGLLAFGIFFYIGYRILVISS